MVDCLPLRTREAMLEGIDANEIIVGAYSDREGGVCPMLAAHRCGGRTSFISFARAWDAFTGAKRARRATQRELLVLRSHLEASIVAEADGPSRGDLGAAIGAHQASARARREREAAAQAEPVFPPTPAEWLRSRRVRRDAERALERAAADADERTPELV